MSKYKNSEKRGDSSEKRFDKIIRKLGGKSAEGTFNDNVNKHIDRFVNLYGENFSVDVKAAKSIVRNGEISIEDIWVEFKNVNGTNGWLYGKQDMIAFELEPSNFILVTRKSLSELCENIVDLDILVENGNEALYKGYQRKNRKDLISRIKLKDVKTLDYVILK